MASRKKTSAKIGAATNTETNRQAQENAPASMPQSYDDNKGYAGTGDHASGKVQSDPNQATPEQIKNSG